MKKETGTSQKPAPVPKRYKDKKFNSEMTEFYQIIGLALFIDLLILIICKAL